MKTTKTISLMRLAFGGHNCPKSVLLALGLGLNLASVLQAQVVLNPAWRVTPDTNKPGFKWNYFQAGSNTGNNNERTESDLAGLSTFANVGDPDSIGAAITNAAPANPTNGLLYFEIATTINLSKTDGGGGGYFPGDQLEPGINLTVSTDGQSAEILSYLTLPAGTTYMGVRSDDGFKCESGPNPADAFGRVTVGERPGGAGDLLFSFVVPPGGAGTYPFRVIWENGGGDSAIEWYTADSATPTTRVLVNDVANGGIPAYRALPGAAAIPPAVKSVTPPALPRQLEGLYNKVTMVVADGSTSVDTNSISLQIDGSPVAISVGRAGSQVTVSSPALSGLRVASEGHTAVVTFKDVPGTYSRTQQWAFYNIENLILPASPVTGENFDSYPEASSPATTVPPGWTATNYTWLEVNPAAGVGVWDLTSNDNDPFVNWIMITTNTVFPLEDEVLINDQTQTINGIPLTNGWMSGNLIYAASDGRARRCVDTNGVNIPTEYAPQIQITVSAPFNLSSVTNPVLTFSSGVRISGNHEQDALEYSVDNGATWLPGMIMQNSATVFVNPDGTFDAEKMLTNVWADVAKFPVVQDSSRYFVSNGPLGQKFGDVLLTPISPALSPFVVNRNDTVRARRVEAIRLPEASKKSQVRLRFTHYGSCGWMWGIDNIAFYDIAPSTPPPAITSVAASGGSVTIKWANGGELQSSPSIVNPVWTSTGNMLGTYTEPVTAGQKFYRVKR